MVHPKARIIADAGPIVIGEGNLIEEQALIINGYIHLWSLRLLVIIIVITWMFVVTYSYSENITRDSEVEPKTMTIGINNVFEVGCGILLWWWWWSAQVQSLIKVISCCNYVINCSKCKYTLTNNQQYHKPWKLETTMWLNLKVRWSSFSVRRWEQTHTYREGWNIYLNEVTVDQMSSFLLCSWCR